MANSVESTLATVVLGLSENCGSYRCEVAHMRVGLRDFRIDMLNPFADDSLGHAPHQGLRNEDLSKSADQFLNRQRWRKFSLPEGLHSRQLRV